MRRVPRSPRVCAEEYNNVSYPLIPIFIPVLNQNRETNCLPPALLVRRNPSYSWASCCEGRFPCPARVPPGRIRVGPGPTRMRLPPIRGGPLNTEALCHVRCKPTVFPILHRPCSIRMRRVLMRRHSACATPIRGLRLTASSLLPSPMKHTKYTQHCRLRSMAPSVKSPDSPEVS